MRSFEEFWPYYLREHAKESTRLSHVVGTSLSIVLLIAAFFLGDGKLLLLAVLTGYGCAWISHFFIEKNRPATFKYPMWSLRADFKLWYLSLVLRSLSLQKLGLPSLESPPKTDDRD